MRRSNRTRRQAAVQRGFSWTFFQTEQQCAVQQVMPHARRRTPRGYLSARSLRLADQEALGGPREGGSKTAVAVINARIAGRSDTSACASGAGSDNVLGKTAADA